MHQRWECALVLGACGDPCVVPLLKEVLQAAWKMEQMWPDYGGFQDGPQIWHAFQDRLAFALGQLSAWDVLRDLDAPGNRESWSAFQDRLTVALSHVGAWDVLRKMDLPVNRMLIATIYLALGALQVRDSSIFYRPQHLFALPFYIQPSPLSLERMLAQFPAELQEQDKRLFANQMDFHERWLSEHADQERMLAQLPAEKQKRIKRVIAGHAEMKARWLAEIRMSSRRGSSNSWPGIWVSQKPSKTISCGVFPRLCLSGTKKATLPLNGTGVANLTRLIRPTRPTHSTRFLMPTISLEFECQMFAPREGTR